MKVLKPFLKFVLMFSKKTIIFSFIHNYLKLSSKNQFLL